MMLRTALAPLIALSALTLAACGARTTAPTAQPPDAIALEPPPAAEPPPSEDPAFARGNDALAAGDLDAALSEYDAVLARDPRHVGARINRSIVHVARHELGPAIDDARAAADAAPDDVGVRAHLIATLARGGRCALAEDAAGDDLGAIPDAARRALAVCAIRSGRADDAAVQLDEMLASAPDDADLLVLRGIAAEESENRIEALAYYNRALARVPTHLDALRNKGMLLARIDRVDDAVETLTRWLEIAPASAIDRPVVVGVLDTLTR